MKLTIFGATGVTGHHLLKQALQAGHQVTAFTRAAASLDLHHPALRIVNGSLEQDATVQSAVRGADAVISVLGARKGDASAICTDGARSILRAMDAAGTRRFIALSAYGAAETSKASLFIRLVRKIIADKMRDKDSMETLVRKSKTDWTLVRPPVLTNGDLSGKYRAGVTLRPGLTGRISRADLAAFILHEALAGDYIRQAPVVCA